MILKFIFGLTAISFFLEAGNQEKPWQYSFAMYLCSTVFIILAIVYGLK